jgi:hypothetical protein
VDVKVETFETQRYCFFSFRDRHAGNGITLERGRDLATIGVYVKPERGLPKFPLALAWLAFGEQAATDDEWLINDKRGPYTGWIALRKKDTNEYVGMPWSTEAIMSVGSEIAHDRPPQ